MNNFDRFVKAACQVQVLPPLQIPFRILCRNQAVFELANVGFDERIKIQPSRLPIPLNQILDAP